MSAKQYTPQLIRARFGDNDAALNEYIIDVFENSAPYKTEPHKGGAPRPNSDGPTHEIGKQIKWSAVLSMAFRVFDFDRNGTQILPDGKVKPRSLFKPYGYLLVDGPTLTRPAGLPIVHKDDFKLIASVFDDREYMDAIREAHMELLTAYQPEKTKRDGRLASIWHCLHYGLVPEGTLNAYYGNHQRLSHPEPSLLFGPFVYRGEVKMHVNQHPQV